MRQLTILSLFPPLLAISKLPMRQLTESGGTHGKRYISKLPMRQLTNTGNKTAPQILSKLPMRQLTERNTERG